MIPYYCLIFIPLFSYFISKKNNKIFYDQALKIFFFFFFLLLSLRNISVGVDLRNYESYFNLMTSYSFNDFLNFDEPIYYIFNKIVLLVSDNFHILLTIIAFISIFPLYLLYKKDNYSPLITIALFVTVAPFSMYFSGLRQSIAMGLAILVYYLFFNKKNCYALLIILCATQIHQSSILLILLFPLFRFFLLRKHFYIILLSLISIFFLKTQLFKLALTFLPGRYVERYSNLSPTDAYGIFALLCLLLLYSFFLVDEKKATRTFFIQRNILVLSVFLQSFASVSQIAMRMNYYFLPFIPVLIPQVFKYYSEDNKIIILISKIVMPTGLLLIFFYKAYYGADILQVFPYKFFWE